MLNAFALGASTQLSLVLSGLVVFLVTMPRGLVGALGAFGAGALIAAVARDLLPEAHVLHLGQSAFWMLAGAGVFLAAEHYVDEKFGTDGVSGALGIVIGSVVDGIPESVIFGIQLASGQPISLAFVAAVFVSNVPQAVAPSADLAATGWNWRRVAGLWSSVMLACGIAAVAGFLTGTAVSSLNGSRAAAFAAGGILAMLSNSLIPFAHERSSLAGLWTVVGFCSSFAMT